MVEVNSEHGFKNYAEAKDWAKKQIARTYSGEETGGKGDIRISNAAINKYLSQSAVDKSDSKDVHLSVLKVLPEVIRESVDAEQHADYKKGEDGVRSAKNGINPNVTIHRLYGAVRMDGKVYRVKVTLKEDKTSKEPKVPHSYEATKIELFAGTLGNSDNSLSPNTKTLYQKSGSQEHWLNLKVITPIRTTLLVLQNYLKMLECRTIQTKKFWMRAKNVLLVFVECYGKNFSPFL